MNVKCREGLPSGTCHIPSITVMESSQRLFEESQELIVAGPHPHPQPTLDIIHRGLHTFLLTVTKTHTNTHSTDTCLPPPAVGPSKDTLESILFSPSPVHVTSSRLYHSGLYFDRFGNLFTVVHCADIVTNVVKS